MNDFTEWRGFDLTQRRAKIEKAYNLAPVKTPEDVPIIVGTPTYFRFGGLEFPEDYFTNPASMIEHQCRGYEKHLRTIHDDFIPYFMPWLGTGVLASGFGCELSDPSPENDPAVKAPCITTPADVARLKMPDPYKDGLMPKVLEFIDYARAHSDLPPGLTDMQGPLDTLGQMCGQDRLFVWMYEEPALVHDLFDLVTDAFIEWVKVQKKHIGEPLDRSNGLQGIWSPTGTGIWTSEDDLVTLGPDLCAEFVVPSLSRIFKAFGGGSVHFCGRAVQHLDNVLKIENVRVVSNSPMGDFESFAALRKQIGGRLTHHIQDLAPIKTEEYYEALFDKIDDFRGVMLVPFIVDTMGMDENGVLIPVDLAHWDRVNVANRIVDISRRCIGKKLAGEPIFQSRG